MSSIGSSLPAGLVVPTGETASLSDAAPTRTTTQSYRPQWLVPMPGSSRSFEMLGLPAPQSGADVGALIAQVSLGLETQISDSDKQSAMSRLSRLAAALGGLDNTALRTGLDAKLASQKRTSDTKAALEAATKASKDTIEGSAATLRAKATAGGSIQDQRVEGLSREIADLKADLALLDPASEEAAALTAKIDARTSARSAVETAVAQSRSEISGHARDLAGYRTQLDAETRKEKPDEATVKSLTAKVADSQSKLNAACLGLASAASTGLAADVAALETTLAEKTAAVAVSASRLALATLASITLAMVFSSVYQTSSAAEAGAKSERSIGIEVEFQDIADELKGASTRVLAASRQSDVELDASVSEAEKRAANVAEGILRALAEVVAALSQAGESALSDPSGAAQNRMRIDA